MARKGVNKEFEALHPDWVRDANTANPNYTVMNKKIKEDHDKLVKEIHDRTVKVWKKL